MTVVLLSSDLMTISQVTGAARRREGALKTVARLEPLLDAIGSGPVRRVIVDLAAPGLDIAALVATARAASKEPLVIVAFGAHVQAERLAAARRAGCDQVLTRGQFFGDLDIALALDASSEA